MKEIFQLGISFEFGKDKFIRGKTDNAKHDGKIANIKREQESLFHLKESLTQLPTPKK